MKFLIRRFLVGLISIPFVAGAYLFLNLFLIYLGAEPQYTVEDAFYNGIEIGIVVALVITFYPQFSRFLDKLIETA
jgi:hypothetical protein